MGFAREHFLDHEDLSEEFICTICQDVLQDPLVVESCEHIYCGECIQEWCQTSSTCPMDRKAIRLDQLRLPQRSFLNLVNGLKRKCPYAEFGCAAVVVLGDALVHGMNCPANPDIKTECAQDCGAMLTRGEIETHNCITVLKTQLAALRVELTQMKAEAENTKDRLRMLEKLVQDRPFDQGMQDWITQMCYDVLKHAPGPRQRFPPHSRAESVEGIWNPYSSLPPRPHVACERARGPHQPLKQAPTEYWLTWQEQLDLVKYQDIIQQRLLTKYGGNWYCQVKPGGTYFKTAVACSSPSALEFCILNYEIVIRRA